MAGELLIQVIDIVRFRAIRPALDELDAGRALGPESRAVLNDAAISPFAHSERRPGFAALLDRILRHPELELRVFLAPRELEGVIEGVVHVLCFEDGAESSLITPFGPSWVVLDSALAVFMDLDWYRAIFLDADPEDRRLLAYPCAGFEGRYRVLDREEVARVAAELQPLLDDPIPPRSPPCWRRAPSSATRNTHKAWSNSRPLRLRSPRSEQSLRCFTPVRVSRT